MLHRCLTIRELVYEVYVRSSLPLSHVVTTCQDHDDTGTSFCDADVFPQRTYLYYVAMAVCAFSLATARDSVPPYIPGILRILISKHSNDSRRREVLFFRK